MGLLSWKDGSGVNQSLRSVLFGDGSQAPKHVITAAPEGGSSVYKALSVVNSGLPVKASGTTPGQVYGGTISNTTASSLRFLKFYDKAGSPTVGTDVPVATIMIPGTMTLHLNVGAAGWAFLNGIWIAATNVAADNDNTAPTAGDVMVDIFYA